MKINPLILVFISLLVLSCNKKEPSNKQEVESQTFQNKGHELIHKMVEKVGSYQDLLEKKDVLYTYTYQTPDGKTDISTEKYYFDGELSYGAYERHERTFPDLSGLFEQGYDGNEYWLKHEGEILNDSTKLKRVAFNRPTNFYWFTMFQKLLDPGLNYEYIGEKEVDGKTYDIVKVSFSSTPEKPTDIYQVYINRETSLVDQFLFTVADFGVMETPLLMRVTYEQVEGMLIPTKRQYKKSTWNADVTEMPWISVTWSNIKFSNGLTKEGFRK